MTLRRALSNDDEMRARIYVLEWNVENLVRRSCCEESVRMTNNGRTAFPDNRLEGVCQRHAELTMLALESESDG